MSSIKKARLQLEEPLDYFKGIGKSELPTPTNILMFQRLTKKKLQQEALQNRSHHRFVLALNLETEGHIHVDNLALPLRPDQALLIFPYQFHHFSLPRSQTLNWLFCTFELEPRTFLEPLRNRVIDASAHTRQTRDDLTEEWCRLTDPQWGGDLQAEQLQATLMRLLLALMQDRQATAPDLPPEPADDLLRAVNRLMSEWRGRTVGVADLANVMKLSESRLRTRFKDSAGIPLGSYIQNYRINRAMALLRTTDLSMADISEEAGFGSPQSFSRVFKKETGQTPRTYRLKI